MQRGSYYTRMNAERIRMGQRSHRARINWEGRPAKAGAQLIYTKRRRSGIRKRGKQQASKNVSNENKSSHVKPNLHKLDRRLVKRIEMSKKKKKSRQRTRGAREREKEPRTHLLRGDKGCLCCPNAVTEIMAKQWQRGLILYQHTGWDSPPRRATLMSP